MAYEPQRAKASPAGLKLKISEPGRPDDMANIIDALVSVLELTRSMRTVETLAPAAYQSEIKKRREAWAKIDLEIDAALALARGEG